MPSLSDKLKSLGVKVGVQELAPPSAPPSTIEQVLRGMTLYTPQGETFLVEEYLPASHAHGRASLQMDAPLHGIARWAGDSRVQDMPPQSFAFLDVETTGLSGGTGTYAFLIGAGRFEMVTDGGDTENFHLAQFFMRDPNEEQAQLAALEEFLSPCQAIVTFNGKTFDVPLLNTRFVTHGWRTPFEDLVHIDLLHLARRLWRERIPSRTLGNLEVQILEVSRSEEDIPGWDIPRLYFDYLRTGDATPLKGVFYHNAMDVISLAALLNHTAHLLADPIHAGSQHGVDLIALAKLFEDLGDLETATCLYIHGLEHEDTRTLRVPKITLLEALQRLALIHKRAPSPDYQSAIALWEQAAQHGHLESHVELAKFYEHQQRDYTQAAHWTQAALALVEKPALTLDAGPLLTPYMRRQWLAELQHRQERLAKKISGQSCETPAEE